jgi:hypothetical protein
MNQNLPKRKLFKGTVCRVAIQCTNELSKEIPKTFLYTGASEKKEIRNPENLASPLFKDFHDAYFWAKNNGFEEIRGENGGVAFLSPAIEFEVEL